MSDELIQKVRTVIANTQRIPIEKITIDSSFEELGIDSMTRIECVFSLEDAFHVEISESELSRLQTVQDVINTVSNALAVVQ